MSDDFKSGCDLQRMTVGHFRRLGAVATAFFIAILSPRAGASPIYVPIAGFPLAPNGPGGLVSDGAGNFWGTTSSGGPRNWGTVFEVNASSGALTTVVFFNGSSTGDNRGGNPDGALVSDGTGNFWGTAASGGANQFGTVFKINGSTGAITTVVDFAGSGTGPNRGAGPNGTLVSDVAGNFWGTAASGGTNNQGTVFEVNASTGAITTVVDFAKITTGNNRGGDPNSPLVSDGMGNYWGTTQFGGANGKGTVFEVNASTGAITTIVDFADMTTGGNRGGDPCAGMVSDGAGNLWGTTYLGGTNGAGTVFEINVSTGAITTVVDFINATTGGNRGANPNAGLVSDGAGNLWGTTSYGGANHQGTVFEVNASTGAITTVVDFFSGMTGGNRGANPQATLVSDGQGEFWGTTATGGIGNLGTVFSLNANSGAISTVTDLGAAATPVYLQAGLVSDGVGNFWGTTQSGGSYNFGTVFKVNAGTGGTTTVVNFAETGTADNRGGAPVAALVSDGTGNFWGTTSNGGARGAGTVFEVKASTGVITTVVDFADVTTGGNRGGIPEAALVSDSAGNFWGTTVQGGAHKAGTVFKVNASTGAITTVVDFGNTTTGGNRGGSPEAALVSDGAGSFWGTTEQGGMHDLGTVFEVNASTGVITTVVDFAGVATGSNRGSNPTAGLVSDGAGNLWGTTSGGGFYSYSTGTVFEVNVGSGAITTVIDFSPFSTPARNIFTGFRFADLVSDGAGNLWGTTPTGGASGSGEVFEVNAGSGTFTKVFDFTYMAGNVPGAWPKGSLLLTQNGFYGTASTGGVAASGQPSGGGEIFFIDFGPQMAAISTSSVTNSGAVVSSNANPEGIATSVYAQYGTDTTYGSQTDSTALGSGTGSVPISVTLAGLTPGTMYHYQLVFVTPNGNFYSPDQTFTTATAVPTVPPWGLAVLAFGVVMLSLRALSGQTGRERK